jgi:pyridoxine 4-dehydrogenase
VTNAATPLSNHATTITIGGDLTVKRLGFGAMRITGPGVWGDPPDRPAAVALLRRAVERGVNFIDTADSYGPEVSENLIAEALHPYPASLVIATKGGLTRSGPDRWGTDCSPAHLRRACESSLKRLKCDRIDLYQLHTVDRRIPLQDSLGALVELQKEGKIRHIGVSNVNLTQLAQARKLARIVSVQNRYNLEERTDDAVVDACARDGLAFLPWYPLGAGRLLSLRGALAAIARSPQAAPSQMARAWQLGRKLGAIAQRHHATPFQVALAWLLHRSPAITPIPGTSSIAHLEENLAAIRLDLTAEDIAALSS